MRIQVTRSCAGESWPITRRNPARGFPREPLGVTQNPGLRIASARNALRGLPAVPHSDGGREPQWILTTSPSSRWRQAMPVMVDKSSEEAPVAPVPASVGIALAADQGG